MTSQPGTGVSPQRSRPTPNGAEIAYTFIVVIIWARRRFKATGRMPGDDKIKAAIDIVLDELRGSP